MADTTTQAEFMQVIDTFAAELDGVVVVVHRNENVRVGHPLITDHPEKFRPLEIRSRWETVEQATAAPGEQRDLGRRRTVRHRDGGTTNIPRDPRGVTDE